MVVHLGIEKEQFLGDAQQVAECVEQPDRAAPLDLLSSRGGFGLLSGGEATWVCEKKTR